MLLSMDILRSLKTIVSLYRVTSKSDGWVGSLASLPPYRKSIKFGILQESEIHTYHPCYAASSPCKRPL